MASVRSSAILSQMDGSSLTQLVSSVCSEGTHNLAETLKNFAEALALLCAALFFLYRVVFGQLFTNMKVELSAKRRPKADDAAHDHLAVTVRLTKGNKGSIELLQLHLVAVPLEAPAGTVGGDVSTIRVLDKADGLQWGEASIDRPYLNLNDGDECSFGTYLKVPRGQPVRIEAVILGRETSFRKPSPCSRAPS